MSVDKFDTCDKGNEDEKVARTQVKKLRDLSFNQLDIISTGRKEVKRGPVYSNRKPRRNKHFFEPVLQQNSN